MAWFLGRSLHRQTQVASKRCDLSLCGGHKNIHHLSVGEREIERGRTTCASCSLYIAVTVKDWAKLKAATKKQSVIECLMVNVCGASMSSGQQTTIDYSAIKSSINEKWRTGLMCAVLASSGRLIHRWVNWVTAPLRTAKIHGYWPTTAQMVCAGQSQNHSPGGDNFMRARPTSLLSYYRSCPAVHTLCYVELGNPLLYSIRVAVYSSSGPTKMFI